MATGDPKDRSQPWRRRLRQLSGDWADLDAKIKKLKGADSAQAEASGQYQAMLDELTEERAGLKGKILAIVDEHPRAADNAIAWGFTDKDFVAQVEQDKAKKEEAAAEADGQDEEDGGGDKRPPKPEAEPPKGFHYVWNGTEWEIRRKVPKQPPPTEGFEDRLGKKGDYTIVKRNGQQYALYTYNFGGNKVEVALRIPKGKEDRYGVKPGEGINVSDTRWGRVEVIGNADELPLGGLPKDALKDTQRYLQDVYGSSPVTEDDDVMAVFIGAEMLGWLPEQIAGGLRKTTWFKESTVWERRYVRDFSPEERREQIRNSKQDVIQGLEDLYGMNWMSHLQDQGFKNPMKDINEWARQIASGEMGGDPGKGLERFLLRHNKKAREIDGTPAHMLWQSKQEELAAYENRPDDRFEQLRAESLDYLGQDKNLTPRLSRSTLTQWANDLVSGTKSDGEWQQFLRDKMKQLFPYFDPNESFTSQADPFKSILERTIGDTVDWSDDLLRDFSQLDDSGKPTGSAMSLRDFELLVRDPKKNPRAYSNGTPLFDQGMNRLSGLVRRLRGGG